MSVELNIFLVVAGVQVLYYLIVFARLNFVRPFSGVSDLLPPVSVIICAKNEAENLLRTLKVTLIQQYKQYEVIVVNDQSDDNTTDVLVEFYKRNSNFKIINIPKEEEKTLAGKKYALLKGIQAASFDTVVVTDADCRPSTTHWLAKIAGTYLDETKVVLSFSPYEKEKTFLNKFIRYENLMTAFKYLGFAEIGLPYMGTGRNLSYKKELLNNFNGFEKAKNILGGDNDLLVNAVANRKITEVCVDKDAFTSSKAKATLGEFLTQKRRQIRPIFKYKFHHQLLLLLFALSNILFYAMFIFIAVKQTEFKTAAIVFASVLLLKLISTFRVYKKLASEDLILFSPLLDVFYAGYLVVIFFLLLLKPKDSWT